MPIMEIEKGIVGIDYIYRSRIDLFERLDFLQDAIGLGKGEIIVGQVVYDLLEYAEDRCYVDDNATDYLFPEFERQKCAHFKLKEKMEYYYFCVQVHAPINPIDVCDYLEQWIEKTACRPLISSFHC